MSAIRGSLAPLILAALLLIAARCSQDSGAEDANPANANDGGLGGGDISRGEEGDDIIYGGEGSDRLFGQGGRNRLFGGTGVDKVYGGPFADLLNVRDSKPNDLAVGGDGTDTCRADSGDTRRSCE